MVAVAAPLETALEHRVEPKAGARVKRTPSMDQRRVAAAVATSSDKREKRASNSSNEKEDSASNSNSTRSSRKDSCSQTELKLPLEPPSKIPVPIPAPLPTPLPVPISNNSTSSENFERQIRKLLDDQALMRNNPGPQGYVLASVQALAHQQEKELASANTPLAAAPDLR